MKIETLFISPEMADKLLATTSMNRAVSPARVLQFANSMRAGKWQLNGETIIVSETGRLLDGQHRLYGVIQFGAPVQMTIVSGVKDDVFETINTGRNRTVSDILGMEGYKCPQISAASAALIWRMYHNLGIWDACDAWASARILERYPSIQKWADTVNNVSRRSPLPASSMLAAMCYFEDVANKPAAAERFFTKVTKGAELEDGSPHLTLRNRLISMRSAGHIMNAGSCWALVARTISAIEAGEILPRLVADKQHSQIKRPGLWTEHMKSLPKDRRLGDLRVRDSAGGQKSQTIGDMVRQTRAKAPDAPIAIQA